jgi:putative membrane protein
MKHALSAWTAIVLAALCTFGCRGEQSSTDTTPTSTSEITATASATTTGSTGGTGSAMAPDDKEFVIKAGHGSMSEVALGEIARQRASNPDVKAFGNRMVQDHSKGLEELKELATVKGLALATDPTDEQQKMGEHLSTLSGSAFDKEYMKHMVDDHTKDVAEFDKASREAQDTDLKTWAGKTLPTLQDHLRQAKEIQRKLK